MIKRCDLHKNNSCSHTSADARESRLHVGSQTIHQSQQGNRDARPSADELPNRIQSRPSLAADQPILGVPVPNYNTQRPRVQNKKSCWR